MRLGSEFATPARAVFGDAGVVPADDKQAGGMSLAVGAQATWPCMPEAPADDSSHAAPTGRTKRPQHRR